MPKRALRRNKKPMALEGHRFVSVRKNGGLREALTIIRCGSPSIPALIHFP